MSVFLQPRHALAGRTRLSTTLAQESGLFNQSVDGRIAQQAQGREAAGNLLASGGVFDDLPGGMTPEQGAAYAEMIARTGGSLTPGVGEFMDLATINDPNATDLEVALALTSLILSYATGGVGPNYGAIRQAAKWGNSDADNLARQLAREYAESRGVVRGVQNSSDAAKSSLKSPELFLILQKSCFVAGTRLLTPDGMKCIEEFQAGDLVLSRSEHDSRGVIQARQVEEVFTRTAPVIQLKVSGRLIGTTREHPFYVIGKGWVTAIALMPGDVLASSTDSQGTIEAIIETNEIAAVYNLRISEHHTYFIGDDDWEFSVWAHNAEYVVKPHNGKLTLFEKGSNTPVEWSPLSGQCGPRTFDTQKEADEVLNELHNRLKSQVPAPSRLSGRQGLAYDTKHLNKHLPDTPEALKLIEKEGAAHVFVDEATLRRVEQAVLEGGEFTGSLRNAERYGMRFDEVIGYRIDAAGNRIPLHYAELKLDPATGKYHLIPRTGPATPGKGG